MRSLASRSALLMFTSGSMIGISPCAEHLAGNLELLARRARRCPSRLAALMTDRSLVPNTPSAFARSSSAVELRHRLHQLDAVLLVLQALVDLDEGHDALVDQRLRGRLSVDRAVHRPLEQDRADHLAAAEAGRGDDPRAHLVDEVEHLLVAAPCALLDRRSPASALGVDPPDWSSAAMKPSPRAIFAVISDWFIRSPVAFESGDAGQRAALPSIRETLRPRSRRR